MLENLIQQLSANDPEVNSIDLAQEIDNHKIETTSVQINDEELRSFFKALEKNTNVKTLDLSNCAISDELAQHLAAMLKVNRGVQILKLTSCCLSPSASTNIINALMGNPVLHHLEMCENGYDEKTLASWADTLEYNFSLTTLDTDITGQCFSREFETFLEKIAANRSLRNVTLSGEIDIAQITPVLRRNTGLESVTLYIAQATTTQLETLLLALKDNKTLTTIDLTYAGELNLSDCTDALLAFIRQNTPLKKFLFCIGEFKGKHLEKLGKALESNYSLIESPLFALHPDFSRIKERNEKITHCLRPFDDFAHHGTLDLETLSKNIKTLCKLIKNIGGMAPENLVCENYRLLLALLNLAENNSHSTLEAFYAFKYSFSHPRLQEVANLALVQLITNYTQFTAAEQKDNSFHALPLSLLILRDQLTASNCQRFLPISGNPSLTGESKIHYLNQQFLLRIIKYALLLLEQKQNPDAIEQALLSLVLARADHTTDYKQLLNSSEFNTAAALLLDNSTFQMVYDPVISQLKQQVPDQSQINENLEQLAERYVAENRKLLENALTNKVKQAEPDLVDDLVIPWEESPEPRSPSASIAEGGFFANDTWERKIRASGGMQRTGDVAMQDTMTPSKLHEGPTQLLTWQEYSIIKK